MSDEKAATDEVVEFERAQASVVWETSKNEKHREDAGRILSLIARIEADREKIKWQDRYIDELKQQREEVRGIAEGAIAALKSYSWTVAAFAAREFDNALDKAATQ